VRADVFCSSAVYFTGAPSSAGQSISMNIFEWFFWQNSPFPDICVSKTLWFM
jgi:hypothetical protein